MADREEKYTKGPFYLWTNMRNGGETMPVSTPNGGTRMVIKERNILEVGSKVTQDELEASDEQWADWIDGGSIRPYPFPDMPANSTDSPLVFLQKKINEKAQSEEERLVGLVQGQSSSDAELASAVAEADSEEPPANETEEEKAAREAKEAEGQRTTGSGFFGR